jgi:hypothetical protein
MPWRTGRRVYVPLPSVAYAPGAARHKTRASDAAVARVDGRPAANGTLGGGNEASLPKSQVDRMLHPDSSCFRKPWVPHKEERCMRCARSRGSSETTPWSTFS